MLQLNYIREKKDEAIARLAIKNFDAKPILEQVLELDNDRRRTQNELDSLLNEANTIAKQVGDLYKQGKKAEGDDLKNKSAAVKESSNKLAEQLKAIEEQQNKLLVQVPNTPNLSVPKGKTPEENENVYQEGEIPKLYDGAKPHWDLTTQYDLIDFELGVKLTGAGFPVYKGKGARLQRALINFFLDRATAAGYLEVQPPILVNEASGYATG
ncbi:MAG: serine--tRNA ligase, partial [Bacteroidia bacterium]